MLLLGKSIMKTFKPDSLQRKIEQPLRVEAEAHFALNAIARKMLEGEGVPDADFQMLRTLFIEMQERENGDIVSKVIDIRDKGLFAALEMYLIGGYFMVSEQIGPSGTGLMEEFFNRDLSPESFEKMLLNIPVPEYTRSILLRCYKKMKGMV